MNNIYRNPSVSVEIIQGQRGFPGKDGYTPVKGVDYVDGKDGYTPVKGVDYFDGEKGEKGEDGYTPVKGVDYFTQSEIEEIEKACLYDDTSLTNRVTELEDTIGTLNDSLEGALNGN